MGAISFVEAINASSAREGFNKLVKEAIYSHGNDSYNGSISTCSLGRITKLADKYTKSVEKKAWKKIEAEDNGVKWEARCLDLGIVGYEIISAKKIAPKTQEKAKFVTKFVVCHNAYPGVSDVKYFNTKTEADNYAMEMSLKGSGESGEYFVVKKPVNIEKSGSEVVSEFEVTKVRKTSKPKTTSKANQKVVEIHKYIYYGWAAC